MKIDLNNNASVTKVHIKLRGYLCGCTVGLNLFGFQPEGESRLDPSALPPLAFKRDRGHTISVMSPVRKPQIDVIKNRSPRNKEPPRSGVSPR